MYVFNMIMQKILNSKSLETICNFTNQIKLERIFERTLELSIAFHKASDAIISTTHSKEWNISSSYIISILLQHKFMHKTNNPCMPKYSLYIYTFKFTFTNLKCSIR